MPNIHVFFAVFGFGDDPRVVTDMLGIEPSAAWAKGDPIRGARGVHSHGRWALHSPEDRSAPLETQLLALLPLLEARAAAVCEVDARFGAGILCACYFDEVNPGFHLDAPLLRRIAALGLPLDFDLYCLGPLDDDPATA